MNGNRELNGQKIESLTDEQVRKSGGGASIQPDTYRYKYDLGEMLEYFDGTQWLTAKVITRQYEEYTIEIARTKKQLEHVSEVMLRNTSVIIA